MALQNVEANITLDLYNHDTTPATVKAIQLDSQTRYVAAMLQNMGAQYDVDSGATVQLIVIRPDKVGVQITGTTFTYGDEGAQFLGPYAELTQVALAVNGKMRGQFKITSGDQILRTEIFAISNGEALDASTDEWADEYDGYNLEEMATSIETNTADIATLEADVSQIKEGLSDIEEDIANFPKIAEPEGASADLYICDPNGNALVQFADGNIETKNFRGFKYIAFSVSDRFVPNVTKKVSVSYPFRKGDRVVFHVERSSYPYNAPWNPGMVVSYYEGDKKIVDGQKIDLAYTEHTITADCDSVSMEYPSNLRDSGMDFVFNVFLLGDIPITPTVVKIKADGTGDYTNLKDALADIGISANSAVNPYRIEVYPGRYDTLDGYTDEEIGSAVQSYTDLTFVGPKLLDGMSLVGIGNPSDIVLYAELDTAKWSSNVRGGISTLNMQGTGNLENVTVIGTHVRYAVHDDYGSQEGHQIKRVVRNCIFRGYDTAYIPHTTYGGGMPVGGNDVTFIDCDFGENAIVHTNTKMKTAVNVKLINCKGHGFRIGDNATASEVSSIYRFDGCSLPWVHYASPGITPHIVITGAGNDHALFEVPSNVLYNTDGVVLVPKERLNLPVGTLVEWYAQNEHGFRYRQATSIDNAKGIIVFADDTDVYVQYSGYVRTDRAGLTQFALNDYVGMSGVTQNAEEAYGRIAYMDSDGNGYIRLSWR